MATKTPLLTMTIICARCKLSPKLRAYSSPKSRMFIVFTNSMLNGNRMHISVTKSNIWSPETREKLPNPHTTYALTSSSAEKNFSTPMMAVAR